MKKLTVLVAVMLIAGLLTGCWVLPESKLDYIEAYPEEIILSPLGAQQPTYQLEVTAYYEDGTYTDVTPDCEYLSSNTDVATVSNEGLVRVVPIVGESTILITYTHHNAWTGMRSETCEVKVTVK